MKGVKLFVRGAHPHYHAADAGGLFTRRQVEALAVEAARTGATQAIEQTAGFLEDDGQADTAIALRLLAAEILKDLDLTPPGGDGA